jgi:hypothetical protein
MGAEAPGGEGGGMPPMDTGGSPAPAAGGEAPLSESTLPTKSKKSKILGMLGEEKEDFSALFDMKRAQQNIYEIENKLKDILND